MKNKSIVSDSIIIRSSIEYREYLYLTIKNKDIAEKSLPGQFVMVKSWPGYEPLLLRPFDIVSTDPLNGTFRLIIKITGKGTGLIKHLKTGDNIKVIGPLGNGLDNFDCKSIGLLLRGVGAAAAVFLAETAKQKGIDVYTFLSASTDKRMVCKNDLLPFSTLMETATDDGSEGYRGNAIDLLDKALEKNKIDRVYTCGSKRFARFVKKIDRDKKTEGFVFLEGFMACGLGDCHGCAVKKDGEEGYYLVCQDGPLFPVSKVVIDG